MEFNSASRATPDMRARAAALLSTLNQTIHDMDCAVSQLPGGQRQAVAISRALLWKARVVIMDEPTAALGVKETAEVLALVRRQREEGVAVVLISHSMEDVVGVADREIGARFQLNSTLHTAT